jgi:hypothetical protein
MTSTEDDGPDDLLSGIGSALGLGFSSNLFISIMFLIFGINYTFYTPQTDQYSIAIIFVSFGLLFFCLESCFSTCSGCLSCMVFYDTRSTKADKIIGIILYLGTVFNIYCKVFMVLGVSLFFKSLIFAYGVVCLIIGIFGTILYGLSKGMI